jgi:rubrerythrin
MAKPQTSRKVSAPVRKQVPRKARAKAQAKAQAKPTAARKKKASRAATPVAPPPERARVDFAKLTLRDALDLAILVEEEAQERYQKLSTMVGGRYAGDAGDVFRFMAENEERHAAELQARRNEMFKKAKRALSRDALDDVEAPDFTKVNVFMSARDAMEVAIEDEVKAYEFYDQALPHVKDPGVRELFRELRDEEKRHETLLRKKMKGMPSGPDIDAEFADQPGSDPG